MQNATCFQSASAAVLLAAAVFSTPTPASADGWNYMDNRSTPQDLIESYYYAINIKSYVQAYSYFEQNSAPPDFQKWSEGYADTKQVTFKLGPTAPDAGAGQIYWALPVALEATQSDGSTKVYTGCYNIHMTNIGMQSDPPYQPMGIVSATLKETSVPYDKVMPGPCAN